MRRARVLERRAGTHELSDNEKELIDECHMVLGGDPANIETHDPRPTSRFGMPGAWAMIVRRLPPMERQLDEVARVGRFFWVEHNDQADQFGFLPDGTYKVICRLPEDDVHLWPYEYSVVPVEAILDLWQRDEIVFHPTNIEQARLNDIVFYARSRGIDLSDAMVMALGTLAGPIGWFEPLAYLAEEMESMEERVHRWKPTRRRR
ncbi:MAG: hypothetical protein ACREIS_05575 [Nitrospiraceae bacterium]